MRRLLRRRLGPRTFLPRVPLQIPCLDPPRLRLRLGRPPLGPSLVGGVRRRPIPTLGNRWRKRLYHRRARLPRAVALARRPGYPPGSRIRHDPPPDVNAAAHLFCLDGGAGAGLYRDDLRQGLCAEQCRAWADFAGYYGWVWDFGQCMVLDRFGVSVVDLVCFLFLRSCERRG